MTSALEHAVTIYRALGRPAYTGASYKGKLKVSEAVMPSLKKLAELDMLLDPPFKKISDDTEIEVEVQVSVGKSAFFAPTWDHLLSNHDFKFTAPESWYVAEDDYCSLEEKLTVGSRRYAAVLSLLKILRQVADYCDQSMSGLKFVFLSKTKLELPIVYTAADLRDVPKVREMEEDISDASFKHKEQRKAIIKVILDEMLKDTG